MIVKRDAANEVAPDGIRPPDSRVLRGLLLGFVGLLLGAAAAVALDRADTRIRSRDDLEDALGLPVVAEIPSLPARLRSKHSLRAIHDPASSFMEAHRSLKTALTLDGTGPGALAMNRGRVVLIASASASEGKSTTAAHLAAALAEVGRSVLLVSADFRRPRVHNFYDVAIKPGLSEMLSTPSTSLKEVVVTTHLPGVRMLASGAPLENPSPLIETVSELLAAARQVFDYVIVDTAPLLVASDALGLIPVADEVIILARAGRTTRDASHRIAELMTRLDAPVLGAVLVGAHDRAASSSSNYRHHGYSDSAGWLSRNGGRSRRKKHVNGSKAIDAPDTPPDDPQ